MSALSRLLQRPTAVQLLVAASFLIVFAKFWEPGIGVSSISYGAEAKSLLTVGNIFSPKLADGLLDPFVEHPYLVLWLDALIFLVLGISAQTIRLVASVLGICAFYSIFKIAQRNFNEKTAVLAVASLYLINMYMNFHSSGWLDIPMVGFTWLGFWNLQRAMDEKKKLFAILGGLFLACAFLTKGVAALAIGPIFIWYVIKDKTSLRLWAAGAAVLLVGIFTLAHYQAMHFFFWDRYFYRQFFAVNEMHSHYSEKDWFWYIKTLFRLGHIVTVIGLLGCYEFWREGKKDWAILILAQVLLHTLAYSSGSRHYDQYVIVVFPWLALAAGNYVAKRWQKRSAEQLAKGIFALALFYFIVIDMIPIRVHFSTASAYRVLVNDMKHFADNGHVYIVGEVADQDSWESTASYVVWFWEKMPIVVSWETLLAKLTDGDSKAIGIVDREYLTAHEKEIWSHYSKVQTCLENEEILVLTVAELCPPELPRVRPYEDNRQRFGP